MSGEITILVQFGIAECKADELKEIFNKAVAIARSEEPGTLSFNQYFDENNTVCYSLERYTGSEALVSHFKNATHNIQKLGDIAKVASRRHNPSTRTACAHRGQALEVQ